MSTPGPGEQTVPGADQDARAADIAVLKEFGNATMPQDGSAIWLPWRRQGSALWVGTSTSPTPELAAQLGAALGEDVRLLRVTAQEIAGAQEALREALRVDASERFADEHPGFSAKRGLLRWQRLLPVVLVLLTVVGWIISWRGLVVTLFAIGNLAFFANVGFKVGASLVVPLRSLREHRHNRAEQRHEEHDGAAEPAPASALGTTAIEYPVYSILVPVYKEASVVASILHNFEQLDYPHDKLDVLILLEEDDTETTAAVRAADPPGWMRVVIVPDGEPRTKPRACNYGLLLSRGQYVVIYDAEDRPEESQLKKALASFRRDEAVQVSGHQTRPLACVQASLNFYNPDYNVLTRMFAIEYAHWFDTMLPGLDGTNTPLPLGGTSNHFLRSALVAVGGWDPYNVTEDADLGLRLTASGYRVDVIRSTTWEEATAELAPWIRQRTRWIKGYLVTAAVNLRRPIRWIRHNGARASMTMFDLILGTPMSFLLYPITMAFTVTSWLLGPVVPIRIPHALLLFGYFNMVVMNLAIIISSCRTAWRRYNWRVALFAAFLPIYWFLHSMAAWRALLQMIHSPHRWEKTPHGITEEYDDSMVDTGGLPHSARG